MSATSSRPADRLAELDPLGRLAVAIGRSQGSHDLASTALEILCAATDASAGLILFNTNDGYEVGGHRGLTIDNVTLIATFRRVGARLTDALEADQRPIFLPLADAPLRESIVDGLRADGIEWLLLAGLSSAGRLSGVLGLGWRTRPKQRPSDAMMLQAAALTGAGLENARLVERLEQALAAEQRRADERAALQSLTLTAERAEQFEELAVRTVNQVGDLLDATGGSYAMLVPGDLHLRSSHVGVPPEIRTWTEAARVPEIPAINRFLAGEGPFVRQLAAGTMDPERFEVVSRNGLTAYLAMPIRVEEELRGVLLLYFSKPIDDQTFDDRTLRFISGILGISLANFNLRERLGASESRYRTLFENSPDALVLEQPDGEVVDANVAALDLFRTDLAGLRAMAGRQIAWLAPEERDERERILERDGRATFRGTGSRPDGTTFPEEIDVAAVEIAGEPRYVVLVRDLSERERLQQELLQAQKMEAIGQLVSGVAHELNNPLAAIIAFSQLIRSDQRLPDDLRVDADLLVQEADRTRRIVQNLLDFARQRPPERHPTRIGPLVESVLALQAYNIQAARISVDVAIPEDLPAIEIDRGQLQQVLLNLTQNAIQAIAGSGRAGAITVEAMAAPGTDRPPALRIAVSDTGPGVAEEIQSRLFMPFFTTKEPGEGTGLGLSVSFGIVAGHGGSLWFETPATGSGATFTLELPVSAASRNDRPAARRAGAGDGAGPAKAAPRATAMGSNEATPAGPKRGAAASSPVVAKPQPAAAAPTAASSAASTPTRSTGTPRRRILILDDEPAIRASLAKAMRLGEFEPLVVADGPAAIRACMDQSFDAVLIDHRMPGMAGTEVYDAIVRMRPELIGHFLFMSGDVLNPELLAFANQRGIRLLAKPFDVATVIGAVSDVARASDAPEAQRG